MSKNLKNLTLIVSSAAILALVLSACSAPTPAPTATRQPTQAPAAQKTEAPSEAATKAPTQAKPLAPTRVPAATEAPTEVVTEAAGAGSSATDSVAVSEQKLGADNTLIIDKVVAAADGFIVIHIDDAGKPGAVIGHAAVRKGENDKVKVTIDDTTGIPATVWAMLHVDAGKIGTYEFPGADAPVKTASGDIVMQSFKVTK